MVIRECVWDVCVYISCTGDEGQLGSSFLWNGRGGWGVGSCGILDGKRRNTNLIIDVIP